MSEKLKTLLAVASLALFILACVGCVRSFLPPTMRLRSDKGKLLVFCVFTDERSFESEVDDLRATPGKCPECGWER